MRNFCLLMLLLAAPGWAQQSPPPAEPVVLVQPTVLPDMQGIPEFSDRSNFMSLAGFLRQQAYERSGQWMTREQSVAALNEQVEASVESANR
jgi:hypothetical protein